MNDLISRKALIAEYDRVHIGPPGGARKLMEDAPAVDAVPVVRCKDCEYHRPINRKDTYENLFVDGCVWCLEHDDGMRADDFCSYGERRGNEYA